METRATQSTERLRSSRTLLYALLFLCVLSIAALTAWMNRFIFVVVNNKDNQILYRTNRITGKTQWLDPSHQWNLVKVQLADFPAEKIPSDFHKDLNGVAIWDEIFIDLNLPRTFTVGLQNLSPFTLSGILVSIKVKDAEGKITWEYLEDLNGCTIAPGGIGEFKATIPGRFSPRSTGSFEWSIVEAYGFKAS